MALDNKIIGKRVRDQREKLSLTREQFAEQVDISARFLGEIENGKKGMSAETLYKICEKADVPADYLLLGRQLTAGIKTPAIDMLSAIPPKYTGMVEDMLQTVLKLIETAEQNQEA